MMMYMHNMNDYGMNRQISYGSYNRTTINRNVDRNCDFNKKDFSQSQKDRFQNQYNGARLYMNRGYGMSNGNGYSW